MPWWQWLIVVGASLVAAVIAWLVAAVIAWRMSRKMIRQAWKGDGPLWGAEFENRPRDPYRRQPRPQSRFDR